MNKLSLAMALLLSAPGALLGDVSKQDLKKLCAAGVSDNLILGYVKSNGPMEKLSAQDLVELKQAGASDGLLAAVLSVPSVSAPPTAPVNPPPAPSTQIVDLTSPSYSDVGVTLGEGGLSPWISYGSWGSCAPSYPLRYGSCGQLYCGGSYRPRYCGGGGDGCFVRSVPPLGGFGGFRGEFRHGFEGHGGGSFGGGHSGFGGFSHGGGHGGHR